MMDLRPYTLARRARRGCCRAYLAVELRWWCAPRGIRTPNRQIRSLVLCVDLVGSRPIWPAHVECLVDPDGSRPVPSDRLDDQRDDQATEASPRVPLVLRPAFPAI